MKPILFTDRELRRLIDEMLGTLESAAIVGYADPKELADMDINCFDDGLGDDYLMEVKSILRKAEEAMSG